MQKEISNNKKSGLEQDNDRTILRIGDLEISMTEEKRGALIEKLSKWRNEATKLFIYCLIAGLLSLIPFENAGKVIITKGQEWVQNIQVEIETNKQLKQERIEKEKAEKAIREAEKAAEKAKNKTEEINVEETIDVFKHLKGMAKTLGMAVIIISMFSLSLCLLLSAYHSEHFSRAVVCFISGLVIAAIGLILSY